MGTELKEALIKENIPDISKEKVQLTNIKLTGVSNSLYDSYLNLNTGLYLFSPNKVTLSFSFSYTIGADKGDATFDLRPNAVKIKVKNEGTKFSEDKKLLVSQKDYIIFGVSKDKVSIIQEAFYQGFNENKIIKLIEDKISIISYYENFFKTKKKDFDFEATSFLNSKQLKISRNTFKGFCQDKMKKYEMASCYVSGELEKEETDKKDVPKLDKFYAKSDLYNTFINKDLAVGIINNIMKEGKYEYNYNKDNVKKSTKDLGYDFTAKSLKTVFNGLDEYADTDEYSVKISLEKLDYATMSLKALFKVKDKENAFGLNIDLKYAKQQVINNAINFNVCVKSWEVTKVEVSNAVTIKDEAKLKQYIVNSYDAKNYQLCLGAAHGICMKDFYSKISSIDIADEGIYIQGEHIYQ